MFFLARGEAGRPQVTAPIGSRESLPLALRSSLVQQNSTPYSAFERQVAPVHTLMDRVRELASLKAFRHSPVALDEEDGKDGTLDDYDAPGAGSSSTWWSPSRLLRSPKDRRRACRLLLPLAIALIVGLAVGLSLRHKNQAKQEWHKVVDASLGSGCSAVDLHKTAMNQSFWEVNIEDPHVIVRPKDWEQYKNCEELASAFFTVRLLFSNNDIRLLDDPIQTRPGEYQFDLLAPLGMQTTATVQVEAILELAWYPGGISGMPCAESACNYTTLLGEGIDWVGQPILNSQSVLPTYQNTLTSLPSLTDDTPLCTNLDNLPGVFNNASALFTPIGPDGTPCRLLEPSRDISLPPPGQLRWWRFLGDSNMRFFFVWNYPKKLGATTCVKSIRKTHVLCWDEQTAWSWDWFFGSEDAPDTNVKLAKRLNETLHDFIYNREDDPWDLRWQGDAGEAPALPSQFANSTTPADRIYISFGSHASQLTTKGWREIMEAVSPTLQKYSDTVVLVLTSATAPARIPVKYIKDRVMRHNIQIKASNAVVAAYAREIGLGIPVLDIFTLTRLVGAGNMIDNVHFPSAIYNIWTSLYFTERFANRQ